MSGVTGWCALVAPRGTGASKQEGGTEVGVGGGVHKTISVSLNKLEQEDRNLVDNLLRTNKQGDAIDL